MKTNFYQTTILLLSGIFLSTISFAQLKVDDYFRKGDKDHTASIQRAFKAIDSIGHGSVEFTGTTTYIISEALELPRYAVPGRRIILINGNGCEIRTRSEISIFNRIPKDQSEALDKMIATRFVISDFTFTGGNKAINIGATYGTSIQRCNFLNQSEACIDIQFGLNSEIHHCIATNPKKDAFVLRCGEDWGGNTNNSQSNHSVISMSRVYAAKGGHSSFKILGSGGIVLRDIISEGSHECDYSVFYDRQNSTTVRLFTIQNFHLEHAPQKAAIYLNSTGIATIDGLFYQMARPEFQLINAVAGTEQVTLRNVPHYVAGTVIHSGNNEVAWRLEYCHKSFYSNETWRIATKEGVTKKIPFYFSGIGGKYQIKQQFGK